MKIWFTISLLLTFGGSAGAVAGWFFMRLQYPWYRWNWRLLVWPALYYRWLDGRGKPLDKEEDKVGKH